MRPSHSIVRASLILLCFIGGVGFFVANTAALPSAQDVERGEVIPQPEEWVSFSATFTTTRNRQTLAGQFFRGADGSELTLENARNGERVDIRRIANFTKRVQYLSNTAGEWVSRPLKVTEGPRRRTVFRTRSPGLRPYIKKLALRKGENGSLNADDGFEAWMSVNDGGTVRLLAPALNFYPVVSSALNGNRSAISDIVVGPVDPALFEPPPGANITPLAEPKAPVHVGGLKQPR